MRCCRARCLCHKAHWCALCIVKLPSYTDIYIHTMLSIYYLCAHAPGSAHTAPLSAVTSGTSGPTACCCWQHLHPPHARLPLLAAAAATPAKPSNDVLIAAIAAVPSLHPGPCAHSPLCLLMRITPSMRPVHLHTLTPRALCTSCLVRALPPKCAVVANLSPAALCAGVPAPQHLGSVQEVLAC